MKKILSSIILVIVLLTMVLGSQAWAAEDGYRSIEAGGFHNIALKTNGTVWAWGKNSNGQLGDGTTTDRSTPVQVSGLTDVESVAAGNSHAIAIKTDGTVWAWGNNGFGQLGDGTTINRSTPVQVEGLTNVETIVAGGYHNIAIKTDGTVWAWGRNYYGQLGDGTTTNRSTPVQVSELTDFESVAAGISYNVAIKTDGTVWAWGNNEFGQLGDGTTIDRSTPVQVSGLADVESISAGNFHNIAIKSDGTVWAWGDNGSGQLGDGTVIDRSTPVQLNGLTNVEAVIASGLYSIVTKTDGTVWAWGNNSFGQLGDGTTTSKRTPREVNGLTDVESVAAGDAHNMAIKTDGTVWAWGHNGFGQLGDGTTINRSTPVQVITILFPAVPANLTAAVQGSQVHLSWDEADDASEYIIKRSDISGGGYITVGQSVYNSYTDTLELEGTYYYVVSAANEYGESENSDEVSVIVQNDLELTIEADEYTLPGNTEFEVQVVINEANGIYAEDMEIEYDTGLFDYISEETADPDGMGIYYKDTETPGTLRYIVASRGNEYGLDDTAQILTLRFTTKNVSGEGEIKVSGGLAADGDGTEYEPICTGKTFTVNAVNSDVNRDGKYTLGDLAIAGRLFAAEEGSWEPFYPDVDSDSSVTEFDLQYIVESILSQN